MNLAKLHIKENLSKSSFVIFAVIGLLVTLLVTGGMTFSAPGVNTDSEYSKYAVEWTMINMIASLAAITLTMGSFRKHLDSGLVDILRVHGLSMDGQLSQILKADIIINILMAGLLLVGMIIHIILESPAISVFGFILAVFFYLLAVVTSTLIIACLNLIFKPAPAALIGVFFIIIGSVREVLSFAVDTMGGGFAKVINKVLYIFPPLGKFGEIERDLFFGDFDNFALLGQVFIYIWVLIGIYYLLKKWRVGREK